MTFAPANVRDVSKKRFVVFINMIVIKIYCGRWSNAFTFFRIAVKQINCPHPRALRWCKSKRDREFKMGRGAAKTTLNIDAFGPRECQRKTMTN
ncbi:hypothetical protein KIN20_009522 [Parelaphostrongylus tenuis]|uniref:Uncharacterized protein n=1 Tax=Parelaphostrongylus tenuis TaxID=148309 RepID=A0AAD5M8A5_PARTN|nr:hypothetical protein KIN20_009522 [Parelaphostrongylus tenuis]